MLLDRNLVPEDFRLKGAKTSDKKWLKWAINKGFIYVFDRGYNNYAEYQWINDQGAFFVTRPLSNIKYEVIKVRKVTKQQRADGVISDKIIEVVTDRRKNTRWQFRLINSRVRNFNGRVERFSFITNLDTMPAEEVATTYKERWQIETFFQWIKMHTELRHWISRSQRGVKIQLYSSFILYLMNQLVQASEAISGVALKHLKDYSHRFNVLFFDIIQRHHHCSTGDPPCLFAKI